jgi:hypothetical protein
MKPLLTSMVLAILLLPLFAVCGCGTRKVDATHTEKSRDSIVVSNSYTKTTKTVLMDVFEARPIDPLRPMWVDGIKYENTIISNDKSEIKETSAAISETVNIYRTFNITKTKKVQKVDNANLWVGLLFVLALFLFLYFKLKTPSL